jgi:nitrite reductase/ring-hydroxylating ferredoxin subunit
MLSPEENALLTRTGPGTPMGALLRRYWVPALLSEELAEPDGPPVRVPLLGERLVAFRATDGRIGLVEEHCPHRGASLYFGRNEECGLRCVYHGWKFDAAGNCVDMPSEPEESTFKDRIRQTAYPCAERGGVIWAYLGPPERQPALPELEWALLPEEQRFASKRLQECNWLQAMEGGIDSSHISFLHRNFDPDDGRQPNSRGQEYVRRDRHPRFEVVDVDFGLLIAARRTVDDEHYYWRITPWLLPWYTMIPPFGDNPIGGHAWVPVDDERCWAWSVDWHPARPLSEQHLANYRSGMGIHSALLPGTFRPRANRDNDYLVDREAQRTRSMTGIQGISAQDAAVQESQGPIYDRTTEHLGGSDAGIIAARRRLLQAVRALAAGAEPPGLDAASQRVRSASLVLPRDVPFAEGARESMTARPETYVASA